MKKIISLYQRNYDGDRLVRDEVVPGAEWVLAGEGKATVKFDGTSCLYQSGKWFKRYDAKNGKAHPPDFISAQEKPDAQTGHWPGWVPVVEADKWHCDAIALFAADGAEQPKDGQTYELCGPKIQGNPENIPFHCMGEHGSHAISREELTELTFENIKAFLSTRNIEGIVWHHPDGRMVKIKKKDFGLKRQA